MNNYYKDLAQINVNDYVEKKGKFSYLSWTYAVDTLRKAHPDATWEVVRFDGMPYMKTELGYFVEVAVTVNGVTLSQIHPVLDNNNRPIATPNAFQINTSIQRALVKSIALHGLGLYIYAGEDLPEVDGEETSAPAVDNSKAKEEAIARAKAKAEEKAKATESASSNADAITEQQLKAIGNMLTLVGRKKPEFNSEVFQKDILAKFGASALEGLTTDQGKEVVAELNRIMRG